nr:hypothetical protein [Tanacetum cinerariifolium]
MLDATLTTCASQLLGGKLVCWSAKTQQFVAMSSVEAEYVAAAGCCANILWIKSQLTDYDIIYDKYQLADIFTKPLDEPNFKRLIVELGYSGQINAKGTVRKGFLPPKWRLLMAQIIQCLGGKTGGYDQITNKDSIILYCLANGVNIDYAMLTWEDILAKLKKAKREMVVPYPNIHNWVLKKNQPEGPPFNAHMLAIYNADEPVAFKAPNTSSYKRKKASKGKKPGATDGHKRKKTSSTREHNHGSNIEATKGGPSTKETIGSKIGHSKYLNVSTNPHVLVDKTTFASEGLETVLTKPATKASKAKKEVSIGDDKFNTSPDLSSSDDA